MRIQTVMPFRVVDPTPKPEFEFDVRQPIVTEEQPRVPIPRVPMMLEAAMETTSAAFEDFQPSEVATTEAPEPQTEATMRPLEASTTSAPLKIILEDMVATTSEQPQTASPEMEEMPATEANMIEPQTDNSINQQELPTRFNPNEQSDSNNFVQNNQLQPNDVNSLSHDHQFHQFPPQFSSFNQPNPNFEIFKSRDLSDSFISQPNLFGGLQPQFVHQPQFIQQPQFIAPRPFTNFHDQSAFPSNVYSNVYSPIQGRNHFSTSRTAMKMNGQAYDFMTHH